MLARLLNFRGIETRNLDQNAIIPHWTDDWLAHAKIIDALTNHFDRLVEHSLVHIFVATHQANEERGAALNIETELNFLFRRPDRGNAKGDQQHDQGRGEQALSQSDVCGKVPTEKNQQPKTGKKCQCGTHLAEFRISNFEFRIFISSQLLNPQHLNSL